MGFENECAECHRPTKAYEYLCRGCVQKRRDQASREILLGAQQAQQTEYVEIEHPPFVPTTTSVRTFVTGATRDTDQGKLDYDGFLHPLVLKRFAEYMHKHRTLSDGSLRDSDNWTKGMPREVYLKSLVRHVEDLRLVLHGHPEQAREDLEEALCASLFNVQGLLLEVLLKREL